MFSIHYFHYIHMHYYFNVLLTYHINERFIICLAKKKRSAFYFQTWHLNKYVRRTMAQFTYKVDGFRFQCVLSECTCSYIEAVLPYPPPELTPAPVSPVPVSPAPVSCPLTLSQSGGGFCVWFTTRACAPAKPAAAAAAAIAVAVT